MPPFDVDKQAAYLRRLLHKGGTLLFARTSCLCTHKCVMCIEFTPAPRIIASVRIVVKQTNSLPARVGEAVDRAQQGVAIWARFRHVARRFFLTTQLAGQRVVLGTTSFGPSKPWRSCAGDCIPAFCRVDHGFWPTRSHAARRFTHANKEG